MQRSVVAVLLVVVLLGTGLVGSVAIFSLDSEPGRSYANAEPTGQPEPSVNSTMETTAQEFDRTNFEITVFKNGSARWTFEYKRQLEDEQAVSEFESYAERFESEETDLYLRFTDQATALVSDGREYTGREMEARNFNRSATVEETINSMGVVRMSFMWDGFAATDGNEVIVSDVFEGGFYIMTDQTLTIRAGDGLAFERVQPDPQYEYPELHNRESVTWSGEREFVDGQPYVAFVPADQAGPPAGDTSGGPPLWLLVVAFGALALALGAGAYVAADRDRLPLPVERLPGSRDPDGSSSPPADGSGDGPPAGGAEAAGSTGGLSDAELMSDEDRVTALLRENGGRMKQVQIVEETDWSKSKVSMLLSEMEDEGTISKLRVGRENIISLDGFEPEATKSPHETEGH